MMAADAEGDNGHRLHLHRGGQRSVLHQSVYLLTAGSPGDAGCTDANNNAAADDEPPLKGEAVNTTDEEEWIAHPQPEFKCPKCGNPADTPYEALMHCGKENDAQA